MIENRRGIHEIIDYGTESIIELKDCQMPENSTLHWHDALEIILPLSNTYNAVCNNTQITLSEGELLFIQPFVLHQLIAPNEGRHLIFHISLSHLSSVKSFQTILSQIPYSLLITKTEYPYESPLLFDSMMEILEAYQSSSQTREIFIYSKVLQMILLIGNRLITPVNKPSERSQLSQEYNKKFTEICEYIDTHLTENLALDDMAKMAGFSKFHFTRLFKQFTNYSFYQYVNVRRIHHAQLLLVEPNMTVTEAAYQSGFSNTSAFDRMFKLHKNCTPSEYRKIYQNNNNPPSDSLITD